MKNCSSCNAQVPDDAKFCPECGAKVVKASSENCPSCQAAVRPGAKFCSKCGTPLGAGAPLALNPELPDAPVSAGVSKRSLTPILLPIIIIPALIGIFFLLMYKQEPPKPAGVMNEQQAGAPAGETGMPGGGMGMEEVFSRIDKMKTALEANPKDTTALFGLGQMFEMASKFAEAEDYYHRFLEVSPNNAEVRLALAGIYFNQQKLDKAEAEMLEAARRRPNSDFVQYNLGVIYAASQKKTEAIKAWHKVMELSPGSELAQKSATNIKSMSE